MSAPRRFSLPPTVAISSAKICGRGRLPVQCRPLTSCRPVSSFTPRGFRVYQTRTSNLVSRLDWTCDSTSLRAGRGILIYAFYCSRAHARTHPCARRSRLHRTDARSSARHPRNSCGPRHSRRRADRYRQDRRLHAADPADACRRSSRTEGAACARARADARARRAGHRKRQSYGKYLRLRTLVIFGGVSINPQIDALRRGTDILVATPGRLLDHAQQRTVDLSQVEILVLDEADRMLDMGFIADIRRVIKLLPPQRQNLMFSATYSDDIRRLAQNLLRQPVEIEVARRNAAVESRRAARLHGAEGSEARAAVAPDSRWRLVAGARVHAHQARCQSPDASSCRTTASRPPRFTATRASRRARRRSRTSRTTTFARWSRPKSPRAGSTSKSCRTS